MFPQLVWSKSGKFAPLQGLWDDDMGVKSEPWGQRKVLHNSETGLYQGIDLAKITTSTVQVNNLSSGVWWWVPEGLQGLSECENQDPLVWSIMCAANQPWFITWPVPSLQVKHSGWGLGAHWCPHLTWQNWRGSAEKTIRPKPGGWSCCQRCFSWPAALNTDVNARV